MKEKVDKEGEDSREDERGEGRLLKEHTGEQWKCKGNGEQGRVPEAMTTRYRIRRCKRKMSNKN